MNFNNFTIKSQEAVQEAVNLVQSRGQQAIEPEHLMAGVLKVGENVTNFIFQKLGINGQQIETVLDRQIASLPKVSGGEPYLSRDANEVLQKAIEYSKGLGDEYVSLEALLLALLNVKSTVSTMLKDAGLNPIFQLTCRDRNRIALESDLLSAAMLGIDNILCLTGDHTKLGDHPQAKPVFDLDSVSLLHTASLLETGKDLGGNDLVGEPPKFAKGAVVSPCSDSVDAQLVKMERKVKAGAEYFQTQAVFEPEKFIKFMEAAKQFGKPVQVGIIIPKSAGMCKFMNKNVAGVHIPDELIAELQADKEKTKAGITGVEIAARIIRECKPYCQGVHIMSLGWESKVPALLEQAGL